MMNNLMIFDDNNLGGSDSLRRRWIMMLSSFSFDSNLTMINWALGVREVSLLKCVFRSQSQDLMLHVHCTI